MTIRGIARFLSAPSRPTDYEITFVANRAGCKCAVTDNIDTLDFMSRFLLGKYMVQEAARAGLSYEQMARLSSTAAPTSGARH